MPFGNAAMPSLLIHDTYEEIWFFLVKYSLMLGCNSHYIRNIIDPAVIKANKYCLPMREMCLIIDYYGVLKNNWSNFSVMFTAKYSSSWCQQVRYAKFAALPDLFMKLRTFADHAIAVDRPNSVTSIKIIWQRCKLFVNSILV